MLKLSYYSIISAPLAGKNERLAYSTRSGKAIRITEVCYECLTQDMIGEIPKVILDPLVEAKIVVPAGEKELDVVVNENQEYGREGIKELFEVVQPSAMCQLGCYYCGQNHIKKNLSEGLVDKIVDRVVGKFEAGNYDSIHYGWFGAEPLMGLQQIRAIHSKTKERLPEVPITGTMITNGLSLKPAIFQELVFDLGVNKFEITLDGIAEFHDKHRYTKKGGNSFDLIYQNLLDIFSREDYDTVPADIHIRCNVDRNNIDGVEPLIRKIAADGIQKKVSALYFKSIYSWGGNDANKVSLDSEEFAYEEMKWKILMAKLGYRLTFAPRTRRKNTCIVTGGESEVYDAYGNVFSCTEIPYAEDYPEGEVFKMGNLLKEESHTTAYPDRPLKDWYETVKTTDKYLCHSCKLFPVCGSACPKAWVEGHPPCPSIKYNVTKELELNHLVMTSTRENIMDNLDAFAADLKPEDFKMYHPDIEEQKKHGIYLGDVVV